MDPIKGIDLRRGLDALKANKLEDAKSLSKGKDKEAIEKAATEFEGLLLHQMLQSMWSTVPKDSLFGSSNESEIYRDMYNDAVAKEISEKQSIGIKDVVLRELSRAGDKTDSQG